MTLLQKLQKHRTAMAPHQRDREGGKLLLEATECLEQHVQLMRDIEQALNDWVVLYAPDFCTTESIFQTTQRMDMNGGTLSYITNLRERVEAARKEIEND